MSHFGRAGPPDIKDTYSLLVLNISFRTTADDLYPLFDRYGKVVDVFIPRDRRTGDSRGFAFVRYKYADEAQKAVEKLDGRNVDGRNIMVQFAKYGPNAEPIRKGRIAEAMPKTRGRSRSRSPRRSRDDYRDRGSRRRSSSRSRGRNERERYRDRERDSHRRSRSRSVSSDYHRGRGKGHSDDSASPARRSHSPRQSRSPRRSYSPRRSLPPNKASSREASPANGGRTERSPSKSASPHGRRVASRKSASPHGRRVASRSASPHSSDKD